MNLNEEILPYIDGNGLVAPNLVPAGVVRASDNGPMFTAEYLIMANRNNCLPDANAPCSLTEIFRCIGFDKELHRAPNDTTPDEVDDYYGVIAAYSELHIRPGFKLPIRLWRQPQLLYAYLLAKGIPSLVMLPLMLYTSIVIATSCVNAPASNTDARRLSWLLIQSVKTKSWFCRLVSKLWYNRLYKVFPNGMKDVAKEYYRDNHPFQRYWID